MDAEISSAGLRGAAKLLRAQVDVPATSHQMLLARAYRVAADFLVVSGPLSTSETGQRGCEAREGEGRTGR
jgi:hypothetical protein